MSMSIEVFEDHYEHNVDENLIDMKNKISLLLLTLPARYERVIRERIFFNKTVNPERIRQIEASAFRMLKNKIYLKEMQSLIKFHIRKNTK
jgi:DNA-directed RNA polymerase sigma subunit (sigma70/sigma32)